MNLKLAGLFAASVLASVCFAQTATPAPDAPPASVIKLPPQKIAPATPPSYAKTPAYYELPYATEMPPGVYARYIHANMSINGGEPESIGADSVPGFTPGGETGELTYSSSGRRNTGFYRMLPITFPDAKYHGPDDGKPHIATAVVRVLVVTKVTCTYTGPNSAGCKPTDHPRIHMMGIGFGRGPERASAPNNAFISLIEMNAGTMRAGYIITHGGIQLGLTDASTAGFNFQKLLPRDGAVPPDSAGSPKDWTTEPGSFSVNGKLSPQGTVLMDTGLNDGIFAIEGESKPAPIPDGTPITIYLPGGKYSYSFKVGDNAVGTPTKADWSAPHAGTYVNTGLHAFNLFDYLYDADGGYLGLRPKK